MHTQGIILTSFGSSYGEAVEKSVGAMEKKIKAAYPHCEVRRVFLSTALVDKWNEKYTQKVQSLTEALMDMKALHIEDIYIQPFSLVADQCYQQLRKDVMKITYAENKLFNHIHIGKPLLMSLGVKNYADDYEATIQAILRHINIKSVNKSILLMANGQNQLEYSALQLKCLYGAAHNVAVFTANGFPNFKQALTILDRMGNKNVLVVPLALIGSEHLMEFLGGDRPDSIGNLLTEEGYQVDLWGEGLGENSYIQELFLKHLQHAIRRGERKDLNKEYNPAKSMYVKNSMNLSRISTVS